MSVDKSPVYEVKAVPVEKVYANDYNPNVVAPPEMKLLELSIWEDGFTMPSQTRTGSCGVQYRRYPPRSDPDRD